MRAETVSDGSQAPHVLKGREGARVKQRKKWAAVQPQQKSQPPLRGSSKVGRAFQSYPKLGLGGQAFILNPHGVQSSDVGCPRKAVGLQER